MGDGAQAHQKMPWKAVFDGINWDKLSSSKGRGIREQKQP